MNHVNKGERLGNMLIQAGFISSEELKEALKNQMIYRGRLGTNLVEMGFITESCLAGLLSRQSNFPAISNDTLQDIPHEVIHSLKAKDAEKYGVIPFHLDNRTGRVKVAFLDPTLQAQDELQFILGRRIEVYVACEISIRFYLERYYNIIPDVRYIRIDDVEDCGEQYSVCHSWIE